MPNIAGIRQVTYVVREDTIKQWAWFWIEGMGGRLIARFDDRSPANTSFGWMHWIIEFGTFDVELLAGINKARKSPLCDFSEKHGDHTARQIVFGVDGPKSFWEAPERWDGLIYGRSFVFAKDRWSDVPKNSWLKRIDHITLAVTPDTILREKEFWVEKMGGELVTKMDDVRPDNANDSMMLWGIIFNKDDSKKKFGVALVAGIDRAKKSQVTLHVEKHGVNSIQHVAFDVGNMPSFRDHFENDLQGNLLSEILYVPDGFGGFVEQVFGCGYESGNVAEQQWPEFVSRQNEEMAAAHFKEAAGVGLYDMVENAMAQGDAKPLLDFSRMPSDWKPTLVKF